MPSEPASPSATVFAPRGAPARAVGRPGRPRGGACVAAAAAAIGCLFTARGASANPHPLPFTYPWETLGAGEAEVEQYVDIIPLRVFEPPIAAGKTVVEPRYELTTEIEYGITDRLELGLYFAAKNAPEELGAGAPLGFDGIKQRLRYRIGDERELPLDLSVYFEIAELHDEIELEEKLNLQKRIGRLKLMSNLWVEESLEAAGVEITLHPTAGFSYQVTPNLWTGVEYWMTWSKLLQGAPPANEVEAFNESAHHFVGPAIALVWGKVWWGVGAYAEVNALGRTMQPGDEFGHFYVRSVVGLSL